MTTSAMRIDDADLAWPVPASEDELADESSAQTTAERSRPGPRRRPLKTPKPRIRIPICSRARDRRLRAFNVCLGLPVNWDFGQAHPIHPPSLEQRDHTPANSA